MIRMKEYRLCVYMPRKTYELVDILKESAPKHSKSALVRDAIRLYNTVVLEQQAGRKILSVDPSTNHQRELMTLAGQAVKHDGSSNQSRNNPPSNQTR